MEKLLSKAINMAMQAHAGQTDKAGMPYIRTRHACHAIGKNHRREDRRRTTRHRGRYHMDLRRTTGRRIPRTYR